MPPGYPAFREQGWVCRAAECWQEPLPLLRSFWGSDFKPGVQEILQHAPVWEAASTAQPTREFPASCNFCSPPSHGACPSPGKCGMIRFSMLMSPDSMGNISFSAFCRAEPGTTVRMAPWEHWDTPSSAPSLTPVLVLALLPLACAGWIPHLRAQGHRGHGSHLQGAKEIEALDPAASFEPDLL